MSFAKSILATRAHNVFLVTGFDSTGRACWHYVEVENAKTDAFQKAFGSPLFTRLSDYGTVLAKGFGKEPPADAANEIRARYSVA